MRETPKNEDTAVLTAVTKMLASRSKRMADALERDCRDQLSKQKHLDEGSSARAYWHAGYVAALRDALRMIERREDEWPIALEVEQSSSQTTHDSSTGPMGQS
jgi:N-methylhydantoinase A/oxoprolinase/acetone carboxylase beta subunit